MRDSKDRLVKATLFLGLAAVFCVGAINVPEVATVAFPNVFFPMLIHTADQSLAVKERRCAFYGHLRQALLMRLTELAEHGPEPGNILVNKERTEFALLKNAAREARTASDLGLAQEKFERAKRLKAKHWIMGWFTCGAAPCSVGPEFGRPDDPNWTVVWPNGEGLKARKNAGTPIRPDVRDNGTP